MENVLTAGSLRTLGIRQSKAIFQLSHKQLNPDVAEWKEQRKSRKFFVRKKGGNLAAASVDQPIVGNGALLSFMQDEDERRHDTIISASNEVATSNVIRRVAASFLVTLSTRVMLILIMREDVFAKDLS